jgi:hypothetical protein
MHQFKKGLSLLHPLINSCLEFGDGVQPVFDLICSAA